MSIARFPLGPTPCWILQPTALPAVLTANHNNPPGPGRSEGPRAAQYDLRALQYDTLNDDAVPEPLLTAKRTAETCCRKSGK